MRPLVAVSLANHWAIKNLLHSGVLSDVSHFADLVILGDEPKLASLRSIIEEFGVPLQGLVPLKDGLEKPSRRFFRQLQKSLFLELHQIQTEKLLKKSFRGRRGATQKWSSHWIEKVATSPLGPKVLNLATQLRCKSVPNLTFEFGKCPDLVVTTNPVGLNEDALMKWAVRHGIPAVTMVPSWDNITSKGVLDLRFHQIAVWNQHMQEEVLDYYPSYSASQLPIVGVPRFDAYDNTLPAQFQKPELWASLGLDPNKKTLLFANTATKSFPTQPEIIQHIIQMIDAGDFGEAQLLLRCHPHDDVLLYQSFQRLPSVAVWPKTSEAKEAFGVDSAPPKDDLNVLAGMILGSDVVINAASTIAIDAAVADRPIVSIAYDGETSVGHNDSIARCYEYNHQKQFLEIGAAPLVRNRDELREAIALALDSPELLRARRRALRELATPGDAKGRFVTMIQQALELQRTADVAAPC